MNKRYVDIDKFKEQVQQSIDRYYAGLSNGYYLAEDVIEDINFNNFELADVEEVRHGKWIERIEKLTWCEDDVEVYYDCSCCSTHNFAETSYCPNCGSKMLKKED